MTGTSWWTRQGGIGVTALVAVALGTTVAAHAACTGDCNGDGEVTVNELIKMVNISLETAPVSDCSVGDANGDGSITVNEIVTAVNNSLNGCLLPPSACGNGVKETGEDCDNGGVCIGGDNAGTACTSESQCQGEGVCIGGSKAYTACAADGDCPNSKCVHCRTFGGNGCAANCTSESDVAMNLQPGQATEDGLGIQAGTSGMIAYGDILTIPILFQPATSQTLTIGKERDGQIPARIPAASLQFPAIPVSGSLACMCLRGAEYRTCGGTMANADGTPATDCTAVFTAGDSVCAGKKPCAAVFGAGNSAAGVVGCTGLDGVNVSVTQDAGGTAGTAAAGPQIVTFSGQGGPGSVALRNASAMGNVIGPCTGKDVNSYGPDGKFCTDDDPIGARGTIVPGTLVTGTATGTVTRANDDDTITVPPDPVQVQGAPFSCSALASGSASGGVLAGAFTSLDAPNIGDIVITTVEVPQ